MAITLNPQEPAINRGIKTVGVGKKGSQALSPELVSEIIRDIQSGKVSPSAQGAFFAGLLAKGLEPQEEALKSVFAPGVFNNAQSIVDALAPDAPEFVRWVCQQLLLGQTLDKKTAYDLGKFLFSDESGDGARGLVASFLRVRYETDDEYEGILQAIHESFSLEFQKSIPVGEPIVQIAEPFDGVDHSYMITPLLGTYLQGLGYRVIHQVGRNSGPKFEMNLCDIAQSLQEGFAQSNLDLSLKKPRFGWFFHQSLISKSLDRWVDLRHQTIKRPFLSTLERFINPAQADILIASAFHPPYGEKMLTIAERAGFKAIVIIRNGIEGTMAFPLLRPAKILLSVRDADGTFRRHEMNIEAVMSVDVEERIEHPKAQDNARLIELYLKNGSSGNKHFDLRLKATCDGVKRALQWLKTGQEG